MFKRRPVGTAKRFIGNGNAWVGDDKKYRGWKLVCSCGANKIVTSHNAGGSMPPHVLIKKFGEAGWLVGQTDADDLCPKCYREYILDRRNRSAAAGKVIAEAKTVTAAANLAAAEHRIVDSASIKNKAHELALLAQLAADEHDHKLPRPSLLDQTLVALVDLLGTLPETAFEEASEMPEEQERRILQNIGFDMDYYQRGSHIDSLPTHKPLPVNSHPVVVPDEKPKPAEDDYDKWLADLQTTHQQQHRTK